MGRPIAFATIIVIAVFLPLFGMSGIEGRMYQPLAAAVMAAVAASLLLALSVVPVVGELVLRPKKSGAHEDVWLIRKVKALYAPILDYCLRRRLVVLGIAAVITVPALFVATRIGSDFMPRLDEGALLLQTVLPPEASLEEVDRLNHRVEDLLREIPEVDDVVRRTGRAEATEDPMPHTTSDVLVVLKEERSRGMDEIEDAMRDRLKDVPGVTVLFTTPLGMRIDEGLGGTPADISVRIFGPDLNELTRLAERTRQLMSGVRGVSDLRAEQVSGLPQLRITVDRSATARVGLSPGDVIRAVRIALVGEKESEIWVGQRRFDLVVRLPDEKRNDINAIRSLFIDSHEGTRIPLGQLATIEQAFGPGAIRREAGSRRVAVEASATGRDLGGVAADIQQTLQRELQLPQGYFFNVGGRVESQARASRSLMTAIALALFAVVLLLYFALDSFTRSGRHPGHDSGRVRRRHCGTAAGGRDVECLVARRPDRFVRHRRSKQPRVGHADARIVRGGPRPVRRGPRSESWTGPAEADDGRHRHPRLAAVAGASPARHRNRATARDCDDWRPRDVDALYAARAAGLVLDGQRGIVPGTATRVLMTQTGIETPSEPNRTAERRVFKVRGMDCAEEVAVLKDVVGPVVGGAAHLSFDILNGRMTVAAEAAADDRQVKSAVAKTGMQAERWNDQGGDERADDGRRLRTILTVISGALTLAGFVTHAALAGSVGAALGSEGAGLAHDVPWISRLMYAIAIVCGAWFVAPKAWFALRRLRPDMNLLMTIAVVGAVLIGEWFEGRHGLVSVCVVTGARSVERLARPSRRWRRSWR